MPIKSYMTTMPPSTQLFNPPHVAVGETVQVDRSPEWNNPRPGVVVSVSGKELVVKRLLESGQDEILTCFHRTDPRIPNFSERFGPRGESGVWQETPQGKLADRIQSLETQLAGLREQIASLARAASQPPLMQPPVLPPHLVPGTGSSPSIQGSPFRQAHWDANQGQVVRL